MTSAFSRLRGLARDLDGVRRYADAATAVRYLAAVVVSLPAIVRTASLVPADVRMRGRACRFRPLPGGDVTIAGDDFSGARELYCRRVYFARPGFEIGPADVVVDAGAKHGLFTLMAARYGRRVVAVEARSSFLPVVEENLERNGCRDKVVVQLGLLRPATGLLAQGGAHAPASHWSEEPPVLTLSDLFSAHGLDEVSLLKVDVEGAESDLFAEDAGSLSRVRRVVIEFHPASGDVNDLVRTLEKAGFEVALTDPEGRESSAFATEAGGYIFARRASLSTPTTAAGRTSAQACPPGNSRLARAVHRASLRIRPAQLGALLKRAAGVGREYVATPDGLWWADPGSQLGQQLAAGGRYEPSMVAAVRTLLRPGDVFVDVGANEGYFSVLAAAQVGAGRVLAVEPQSRLIPVLLRNLELNGAHNVTVRAVALDEAPGWQQLFLCPTTNPGASGFLPRRLGRTTETVPTRTLDQVLDDEKIDTVRLLKVDCEGAEDRVVAGAGRLLSEGRVQFVAMEYHPTLGTGGTGRSLALHATLVKYGYVLSIGGDRHLYHRPGGEAALEPFGTVRTGVDPDLTAF